MDYGAFGTALILSSLSITMSLVATLLLTLSIDGFLFKINLSLRGLLILVSPLEISELIFVRLTFSLHNKISIIGSRTRSERPTKATVPHQLSFNNLIKKDSGLDSNLIRILGFGL